MTLTWINYLCAILGNINMVISIVITSIVLKRKPKEKINWLFAMSFFFIAIAYALLPVGAFTNFETNPIPMIMTTKFYGLSLFLGLMLLMLGSIALNFGFYILRRWYIIIPTLLMIATIAVLLFVPYFESIEVIDETSADIKTGKIFMMVFYPICFLAVIIIFIFLARLLKLTEDQNVRLSLKLFIFGFATCMFSIIPNLLSNILADSWSNAQILNGLEFILVSIGVVFLLSGFLVKSRKSYNHSD